MKAPTAPAKTWTPVQTQPQSVFVDDTVEGKDKLILQLQVSEKFFVNLSFRPLYLSQAIEPFLLSILTIYLPVFISIFLYDAFGSVLRVNVGLIL